MKTKDEVVKELMKMSVARLISEEDILKAYRINHDPDDIRNLAIIRTVEKAVDMAHENIFNEIKSLRISGVRKKEIKCECCGELVDNILEQDGFLLALEKLEKAMKK